MDVEIKLNKILESMEEFVEGKSTVVFTGNIVISKNELLNYIQDIRTELPKSVTQASAIYEERERIISDAQVRADDNIKNSESQADSIIVNATARAKELVEEHELTKKAKLRAEEIIKNAEKRAADILKEAMNTAETMKNDTFDFVEGKIAKLENIFSHAKYNAEYVKEEFYKHGGQLFNILELNLDKEYEAINGNKKAFASFRENLENGVASASEEDEK